MNHMDASLFSLEKSIAEFLLRQLEQQMVSTDRVTEIAKQVLNITLQRSDKEISPQIKQQLSEIPELAKLFINL